MHMLIRSLEREDFSRGFLETLAHLAPVGLTPEEAVTLWDRRLAAGIYTAVAVQGERVVGTASIVLEPKFIHRGGMVGHIEDVAVHSEFNGLGIGRALLDHLLQRAAENRCYKVILNCHDHLLPFYRKAGFREHDRGMRIDLKDRWPTTNANEVASCNATSPVPFFTATVTGS